MTAPDIDQDCARSSRSAAAPRPLRQVAVPVPTHGHGTRFTSYSRLSSETVASPRFIAPAGPGPALPLRFPARRSHIAASALPVVIAILFASCRRKSRKGKTAKSMPFAVRF
jgi:hypothetical protein